MKELPSDPHAFQARVISAFCQDLIDIAAGKSSSCRRTNAIRAIPREREAYPQESEGDCLRHRRHSRAEPEEVSALRASVNYRKNNRDGGMPNKLPPSNT